jgi:hypothetical protein
MIHYNLTITNMWAEIHDDIDDWFKVSVHRGMDLTTRKWPMSDISWGSYSGKHSQDVASRYARLLDKAVAVAAIFDSPIYVFEVKFTAPAAIDATTGKPTEPTVHITANNEEQVRLYMDDPRILNMEILGKETWASYVKAHYKDDI